MCVCVCVCVCLSVCVCVESTGRGRGGGPSRDGRVVVRPQVEPLGAVGVAGDGAHLEGARDGLEVLGLGLG